MAGLCVRRGGVAGARRGWTNRRERTIYAYRGTDARFRVDWPQNCAAGIDDFYLGRRFRAESNMT